MVCSVDRGGWKRESENFGDAPSDPSASLCSSWRPPSPSQRRGAAEESPLPGSSMAPSPRCPALSYPSPRLLPSELPPPLLQLEEVTGVGEGARGATAASVAGAASTTSGTTLDWSVLLLCWARGAAGARFALLLFLLRLLGDSSSRGKALSSIRKRFRVSLKAWRNLGSGVGRHFERRRFVVHGVVWCRGGCVSFVKSLGSRIVSGKYTETFFESSHVHTRSNAGHADGPSHPMRRPCDLQVLEAARQTSVRSVSRRSYPYVLWGSGFYRNRATGGEAVEGRHTLNIFQSLRAPWCAMVPSAQMESPGGGD